MKSISEQKSTLCRNRGCFCPDSDLLDPLGPRDRGVGEMRQRPVRIGAEEDGKLIAGLDACITAYRILYVSTVFVDEEYRRQGIGTLLVREMEKRARQMGATMIRLDTFSWQGKEFYEALGYQTVGSYENTAEGYAEYFFLKRLV